MTIEPAVVLATTNSVIGRIAQSVYETVVEDVEAAILAAVTAVVGETPIDGEDAGETATAIENLVAQVRPHVAYRLQLDPPA